MTYIVTMTDESSGWCMDDFTGNDTRGGAAPSGMPT
jgi:hypothetical protein